VVAENGRIRETLFHKKKGLKRVFSDFRKKKKWRATQKQKKRRKETGTEKFGSKFQPKEKKRAKRWERGKEARRGQQKKQATRLRKNRAIGKPVRPDGANGRTEGAPMGGGGGGKGPKQNIRKLGQKGGWRRGKNLYK